MLNSQDPFWLKVFSAIYRLQIALILLVVFIFQILYLSVLHTAPIGNYFFNLFYICCFILFSTGRKVDWSVLKEAKFLKPIVLIVLSNIGLIYFFNSKMPLFADEISQLTYARDYAPISAAFRQQQMPLGYFFSAWSAKFFPISIGSLRWPAFLFSTTFYVLYFCFLKSFSFKTLTALLSVALLALVPEFLRYSIEGRPISLGLLMALLFFMEVYLSVRESAQSAFNLRVFAITTLFLLSLGFQPPLVVFTVAVLLVSLRLIFKMPTMNAVWAIAGALAMFVPFQWTVKAHSDYYLNDSFENIQGIQNAIIEKLGHSFFMPFNFIVLGQILLGISLALLFKPIREKLKTLINGRQYPLAVFFFLVGSITFILSAMAFSIVVNTPFKSRYVIVGGFCLNLAAVFLIQSLLESNWSPAVKYFKPIVVTLFFGMYFIFAYPSFLSTRYENRKPHLFAFEKLLKLFQKDDLVIAVCPERIDCWDYNHLLQYFAGDDYEKLPDKLLNPIFSKPAIGSSVNLRGGLFLYIEHRTRVAQMPVKPVHYYLPGSLFYLQSPNIKSQLQQILTYVRNSSSEETLKYYDSSYTEVEKILLQLNEQDARRVVKVPSRFNY